MKNRLILTAPSLVLAIAILVVSVFRTTRASLVFGKDIAVDYQQELSPLPINYNLPETLSVYPSDLTWNLKALEDKVNLVTTFDDLEKSRLLRRHADERLVAGVELVKAGDTSLGLGYFTKAEEYLMQSFAQIKEVNTYETRVEFQTIANASLKHREVLEDLLASSPDEVKPEVVIVLDKAKLIYKETRVLIELFGDEAPKNVFE